MSDGWRPISDGPSESAQDWRSGRSASSSPKSWGRWRVGAAWGGFLLVCAGFFWLTTWVRPPQPGRFVLMGAGCETNLLVADNAAGFGGLKQLAALDAPLLKPAGLVELRSDSAWEPSLERLKGPMLVVAISAHGGKDARGPYLLPTDTNLRDDDRQRIRVAAILDKLAELPPSQKKLLIIDAAFMPHHAALGMLTNDFARGLADLDERIAKIPNLVVLCSTSPDELSWSSPEWGSTAFAHFLGDGLRGFSDADEDGDHRIDAFELWKFLHVNVKRWAAINRFAEQTPMLLPRGDLGEQRARKILVSLVNRKYQPAPIEERPESPAWKAAWEKWAALREQTPQPGVYAPYRWQKYQAGVLRVESLLRFGDVDGAGRMQADLDRWEKELRQDAELPAPTLKQTWSMARMTSETKFGEPLEKRFQKLWEAPSDEKAQEVWDEWQKEAKKDPALTPPLRDLTRLILDRVAQEPGEIAKASQRLRLIREGNVPYPPEPHFALMFGRDGPPNPPANEFTGTLPLALQVRRKAELVAISNDPKHYSYSERLDPWVGTAWLEIDRERLKGQDLLFTGSAEDWRNAGDRLTVSLLNYRRLRDTADVVRRGFAVRDRIQADLPFFRNWALANDFAPVLQEIEKDVLELDAGLARGEPVSNFEQRIDGLEKSWAIIEARHAKSVELIRSMRTIDIDSARIALREIDAALAVPFAGRADVVALQAKLSRQVLIEGRSDNAPKLNQTAADIAKSQGKLFGELTLARLGSDWFHRLAGPKAETFGEVAKRVEVFGVADKWWESAGFAGEQIGSRIAKINDETRRLTTLDPKASRTESRTALQDADRLVRLADARTPLTPGEAGPATLFRRWLTAELLDRQSQRTWQDHWFDDNPAAEPYFRTVCRGYQLDTQRLVGGFGPAWKQSLKDWEDRLNAPGELVLVDVTGRTLDASGKVVANKDQFAVLTSEQSMERDYRLQPSADNDPTPGGLPVVWVEAFQGLTPLDPRERQRVVVPVPASQGKKEPSAKFECKFMSPLVLQVEETNALTPIQRTSLVYKGLFRGQQIRLETRVEVQPTADVIVRQLPLPNKASVAVRTRRDVHTKVGSAQGAVAFVLDASGSMRPIDETMPDKSRYFQAVAALKSILQKLPKDTQVSVWTFGQALGLEKTVENAEETIIQALPPTPWDPLNPKQLDNLMARLAYPSIEPWNQSPIARTLLKAKEDLAKATGFKTIVTITDGGDNRFDKDEPLKSKYKNVVGFLRDEFDKGDVTLNFVVFPPANLDETKALKELQVIEPLTPAGKIYPIAETDKLIESLEAMLKQRLNYYVEHQGRNVTVDGLPQKGLDVSAAGANYRWFGKGMAPGGHKLRVDVAGRTEKNILLHPGDLLLADLVDTPGGGYTFERFLFSSDFPWKRWQENGRRDWKMAILQNQLGAAKDLEMLVSLEKTVDRRESILEQIKPRDAWLEVTPAVGEGTNPPLRWSYLAGYPAPAWAVNAPAWPAGAPAKVQMWWNPDEEARSAADLVLGEVADARDRAVFLPGEPPLSLESVRIEKHFVEVSPGQLAPRTCIVVRIRHAPGRPVIARLQGLTPTGSEQRLYVQANRTASLFWFEPDLDPKGRFTDLALARLRLISIAAFKEEARRRDYWLEIRDLAAPDPADERPRPPVELK